MSEISTKFPSPKNIADLQEFLVWVQENKIPLSYLDFGTIKLVLDAPTSLPELLSNDEEKQPAIDENSPLSPMYQRLMQSRR